jgi:hypothetical protein
MRLLRGTGSEDRETRCLEETEKTGERENEGNVRPTAPVPRALSLPSLLKAFRFSILATCSSLL